MAQASQLTTDAVVRLTWAEICARFPGEWVTLVDADWVDEDYTEFRTAVLVKHSPQYADSFPGADQPWGSDDMIVHEFTGPIRPARPLYLR